MDLKNIKYKQFYKIFITTSITVYVFVIAVFFLPIPFNTKLSIAILLVFLQLIFSLWARPKLYLMNIQHNFLLLKSADNKPVKTKHKLFSIDWQSYLFEQDYLNFRSTNQFSMFYKISLDPNDLLMRKGIIDIVFMIYDGSMSFHNPILSQTINTLEEQLKAQKLSFYHYSIINIKGGTKSPKQVVGEVDEVVFEKHKYHHICVINAYYNELDSSVYYLRGDGVFYPTILYKYTVEKLELLIDS